jgi:16S rRNA (cytosine967-C5)-methyltransferase
MRISRNQIDALAAAIAEAKAAARPADMVLHRFFREHPDLGARDRAIVAEGLFSWLRRRRSLEAAAATDDPRRLALAVLVRDQGHSVRELTPLLSKREASWLEEFKARRVDGTSPAVAHDVPDWLWDRLGAAVGDDEREAMTRAWLQPAPLDIRINPLTTDREAVRANLETAGIAATPTPHSPLGLRIGGRPALNKLPAFANGDIEVQDEGSQLLGLLVQPKRNGMVVDFCAGAGGKTLLLGALMRNQGRVYAFDTSEKRLTNLKPRLKRSGLSNVQPQLIAHENDARIKRLAGKIDSVLIDAPCSGLGTLRRNPDLKWRQTPETIAELSAKQRAILASAARLPKPGGRIVYATCSVLPEENEDVVETFLRDHPEYRLVPATELVSKLGWRVRADRFLRLAPHREGCDAFFAAVLERRPADAAIDTKDGVGSYLERAPAPAAEPSPAHSKSGSGWPDNTGNPCPATRAIGGDDGNKL